MTRKSLLSLLLPLAIMLATFTLSGCATTEQTRTAGKQSEVDHRYVSAVDRQARRAGIEVVWINPPRKRDRRKNDD